MKRILSILLAGCLATTLPAQNIFVSGKVVDDDDQPVAGAFVSVQEGTPKESTLTGNDGNFKLFVKDKSQAVIVVSMLGFETFKTKLTSETLFVKLKEEAGRLDDVVVVAYGEVKKKDLTGVVSRVDMEEIAKAPVTSFAEALAGRVAGVSVSAMDGQPGSEMNIIIRGANSITQSNSPLYVIDGFPVEDLQTASLNPDDIKTFNILKDASATALYGARGANGVIVIETKGGKVGRPEISINARVGIAASVNKMEMMSPYEFVKYQLELYPSTARTAYLNEGKTLDYYRGVRGIDWQDQILRTAIVHNYTLAVRGGTEHTKYSVSGALGFQPGVILNTGSDNFQLRSNLEQKIGKKVSLTLNLGANHIKNYGQLVSSGDGGTTSSYLLYRTWAFRPVAGRSDINLLEQLVDEDNISSADIRLNPYLTSKNDNTKNTNTTFNGNLGFRWSIVKGLQLKVVGMMKYNQEQRAVYYNSQTTQGSSLNPTNSLGVNGLIRHTNTLTWNIEGLLQYGKKVKRFHQFDIMVGASCQERRIDQYGYSGYKLDNYENLGMSGLDNGLIQNPIAYRSSCAQASFFGRFNYNYKSIYLLTLTLRADGSSKFPKHKWGFFPSGAFVWNLGNEKFMEGAGAINVAKLRVTYGVTGNNRIGDSDAYAALSVPVTSSYSFGNQEPVRGYVPTSMGNADLKWETTYQLDAGFDLSMFDNRLGLTFDFYHKITDDLLLLTDAPRTTGYPSIMKNTGKVRNSGVEITLNTVNIRKKNFTWSTDLNFSLNRNKVLALEGDNKNMFTTIGFFSDYKASPLYLARVGSPMGLFYGYVFDGVYQYEDFDEIAPGKYLLKSAITSNASEAERASIQPGDIKYKDLNGDKVVNDKDMTVIGNGNPLFIGGMNNVFVIGDFDVSFLLQWSCGNDIYNANRLLFEGNAIRGKDLNQYASYADRWTPENPSNTLYRAGGEGPSGRHSSRVVEDGSYLRLKTVSLGYRLPDKVLKKMRISDLHFSISGQNLLTLAGYSGMDPEVSTRGRSPLTPGFDYSAYPIARTVLFGIRFSF